MRPADGGVTIGAVSVRDTKSAISRLRGGAAAALERRRAAPRGRWQRAPADPAERREALVEAGFAIALVAVVFALPLALRRAVAVGRRRHRAHRRHGGRVSRGVRRGGGFRRPAAARPRTHALSRPPGVGAVRRRRGLVLGRVPDVMRDRNPERLLVAIGNSWFAVGPALVLAAGDVTTPALEHWPLYVLALATQFAGDTATGVAREWLVLGVPPRLQLRMTGLVFLVDTLLTPIGLLAALVAQDEPLAFLLVLPLVALLAIFARERAARIDQAIELSKAYRGTALLLGEVISDDDEYTGEHSYGVIALALQIADEMGLGEDERRLVEFGALLHDVGKIAVPEGDHQQGRPAGRRRVGDHEAAHRLRPADARQGRRQHGRRRRRRARVARALGRRRLSRRHGRGGHPAGRAHRRGRRRVQRDHDDPLLPARADARGRARRSCRPARERSSTRRSSKRSRACSPTRRRRRRRSSSRSRRSASPPSRAPMGRTTISCSRPRSSSPADSSGRHRTCRHPRSLAALDELPEATIALSPVRDGDGSDRRPRLRIRQPAGRRDRQAGARQARRAAHPRGAAGVSEDPVRRDYRGARRRSAAAHADQLRRPLDGRKPFSTGLRSRRRGSATRCSLVYDDVGERMRVHAFERRYGAVLEATSDWVSIADGDNNLVYINPAGRADDRPRSRRGHHRPADRRVLARVGARARASRGARRGAPRGRLARRGRARAPRRPRDPDVAGHRRAHDARRRGRLLRDDRARHEPRARGRGGAARERGALPRGVRAGADRRVAHRPRGALRAGQRRVSARPCGALARSSCSSTRRASPIPTTSG